MCKRLLTVYVGPGEPNLSGWNFEQTAKAQVRANGNVKLGPYVIAKPPGQGAETTAPGNGCTVREIQFTLFWVHDGPTHTPLERADTSLAAVPLPVARSPGAERRGDKYRWER